ncbi:MAG: acyltransferase domain-containing protein, partial [Planctomycetota bacterium]
MTEAILLFPGQGSQSVGMGKELVEQYDAAKAVFDAADQALEAPISPVCFEGPMEALTATENAQPAVTTMNLAV